MFAVEKLEAVRDTGKVLFFKLVKDGVCWFDNFFEELSRDAKHASELKTILSLMDYMAETNSILPATKFNSIKEGKNIIGYEFKKNDLRVYCIKPISDVVVIFGGYKKNQKNDIKKLRGIVNEVKDEIELLINEKKKLI